MPLAVSGSVPNSVPNSVSGSVPSQAASEASTSTLTPAPTPTLPRKSPARPKSYACPINGCTKCYSRPSLLEQHIRSHIDDRLFPCSEPGCQQSFLRKSHLEAHRLSHLPSELKPFRCPTCGKGLNTAQHLRRHERTHVASNLCPYDGCSEAFHGKTQLANHIMIVHKQEKRHKCPFADCGAQFMKKSRLANHVMKAHSETPQYICGHTGCSAAFFTWSLLQAHVRSEHPKLRCPICGKSNAGRDELFRHLDAHNEIPVPFCDSVDCDFCGEKFSGYLTCLRHILSQHKDQEVPRKLYKSLQPPKLTHSASPASPDGSVTPITPSLESIIDRITGTNYETGRPLECPVGGCKFRFSRQYDRDRHVKSQHAGIEIAEPEAGADGLQI